MNIQETVAVNLRIYMAVKNYKISDVSKITGISRTTLTNIVKADCQAIHYETLEKLCECLMISPAELMTKKDEFNGAT